MDGYLGFVLIGLAAGLLANRLVKGGRFGAIVDLVGGVFGALLGVFVFRFVLSPAWGFGGALFAAASGAALLIFDLRLVQKNHAERLPPLRVLCRSAPIVAHTLGAHTMLAQRKQGTVGETCQRCGQKHLA